MTDTRAPSRLPPAPAPPHDPCSLMLAGHLGPSAEAGWRRDRATRVDVDPGTRSLVLSPAPASARWLTEPNATFGGRRVPPNVAVTSAGDVLLLDLVTAGSSRCRASRASNRHHRRAKHRR